MKLYKLEYSSYNGCDGWRSWYGDEVFTDKKEALEVAYKKKSTYVRCEVEEFETK